MTGVDLSQKMVEIAKQKYGQNAIIYQHNLLDPFEKEQSTSFDLIISALAIHYLENLKKCFEEFSRLLKPGGHLVFSTHHPFLDFKGSQTGNYFEQEHLTQTWKTIGKPIDIEFYRRPLSSTLNAALSAGFVMNGISEGEPTEELRLLNPKLHQKLATQPQFIFARFIKV